MVQRTTAGVLAGLAMLVSGVFGGCPVGDRRDYNSEPNQPTENTAPATNNKGGVTGIIGYSTREEILADRRVAEIVDAVRNNGYELNLSDKLTPPNIEETYMVEGNELFSGREIERELIRFDYGERHDIFRIIYLANSFDGGIRTDVQTKGNPLIFGEENRFTVYSITERNLGGDCVVDFATIFDGEKSNAGLNGVWIEVPVKNYSMTCDPTFTAREVSLRSVRY
ncbi:MAG: hypothetical protein KKD18_00195 [Nanoarchaeota archaeon]|nr:hypothetical protein [Nanoarchaeota archaeon]MBU0976818.1 hypothetical protein [Nanoarchaeota archaeon]